MRWSFWPSATAQKQRSLSTFMEKHEYQQVEQIGRESEINRENKGKKKWFDNTFPRFIVNERYPPTFRIDFNYSTWIHILHAFKLISWTYATRFRTCKVQCRNKTMHKYLPQRFVFRIGTKFYCLNENKVQSSLQQTIALWLVTKR